MVQLNLEIFISYSRKDKDLLLEFNSHLSPLLKRGKITLWFDRDIPAGAEWEHQINTHLNSAQIILLLTSDNFFASKYCEIEMTLAIKRSRAGDAIVIPIYLETSYEGEHRWEKAPWKKVPFSELQVLPRNGKSITSSPDCRAEAFVDVVNEIGKVAKRQFIEKAKNLSNNNNKQEALKVLEQAIDLDSEDADANRIKVKWLLDLNRKEEALTTLDQLLQLDPKDVDANWEKVKLLLSLNLKEKALVALEQVIHLAPNDASAYRIKVKMLKEFNRKEEALTTLDQLLRINPKDVDAYREKGEILLAIDRKKEALAVFEQVIRLDSDEVAAYFYMGNVYFHLENYQRAFDIYKQAIESSARTKKLAGTYIKARDDAIQLIRDLSSKSNSVARAADYNIMGELLKDLKSDEDALDAYNRAIKLDHNNIDFYRKASRLLVSLGRQAEALQLIRDFSSDRAADNYIKGKLLEDLKSDEDALDAYNRAIKLDHDNIGAYRKAGRLLLSLQRYEEALAVYEKAIKLEPNNSEFYIGKGTSLKKLNRDMEAFFVYDGAIRLEPKNPKFYIEKGAILNRLTRKKEAIAAYQKAIELEPRNVYVYRTLGELHDYVGEYKKALVVYEEAIKLRPDNQELANLLINKGDDHRRLGDSREALNAYKEAEICDKGSSSYSFDYSRARERIRTLQREEHPRLYQLYLFLKFFSINTRNFLPYLIVVVIGFILLLYTKFILFIFLIAIFIGIIIIVSIFTNILQDMLD